MASEFSAINPTGSKIPGHREKTTGERRRWKNVILYSQKKLKTEMFFPESKMLEEIFRLPLIELKTICIASFQNINGDLVRKKSLKEGPENKRNDKS